MEIVRLYGRKKGRLKPQELSWLQERLPFYQNKIIPTQTRQELWKLLGGTSTTGRLILEIGSGNGQYLIWQAMQHPQDRFIGVDPFLEGVAGLIRKVEANNLNNVAVLTDAAQLVLAERIPPSSLDQVIIHFPDPWPKKRHQKRRLIQKDFLDLLASRMSPAGHLQLATDWAEYAQWMLDLLQAHEAFTNLAPLGQFAEQPKDWIPTRFQEKGLAAGRPTFYLAFCRVNPL
ncbi:MAG: tRNA (guanosine(46)-N7)-methyltransferase TrmB [Magnetococcus sp. DMHC-6]